MAPLPKRRHSTRRQGKRTAALVLKLRKQVEHTKTFVKSK
jgi:hypothetical protein